MENKTMQATPSLRALLEALVDYAGLFPPAGLPLDEAVHRYARYRQGPYAWMLSRFVCPTARLDELAVHVERFTPAPPFRFSSLGTSASDGPAFQERLATDLKAIKAFHGRLPGRVLVDALEVRLPALPLRTGSAAVCAVLQRAADQIRASGLPRLDVFYEVPVDEHTRETVPAVLAAIAACNREQGEPARSVAGLKIRCGGETPAAFPGAEEVAFVIGACRDAGVRFKATAGLHHPVRRYDSSVQTYMHGFLNVFGAAVLAAAHPLEEEVLRAIVLEEDPHHFRFTPEAFAWRAYRATPEVIRQVRAFAVSFGSCSFEEPVEDLQALGLL